MFRHMGLHVVQDGSLFLREFFHSERMFYENLFTVKDVVIMGFSVIKNAISG